MTSPTTTYSAPSYPAFPPPLRGATAALLVGGIGMGLTVWALYVQFMIAKNGFLMDLQVFQDAGRAYLAHGPLYEGFESRSGFGFIYPPFAALMMAPLAWINQTILQVGWNTGQVLCVALMVFAALRLGGIASRAALFSTLAVLGVCVSFEPIANGLGFGQVDVLLATLVLVDLAGIMPRPFRGTGIGLAAGIKITPAAFGLIFLIRRDWHAAARAAATGLVTMLIGFLVRPDASVDFWTSEMWNTDRAGNKDFFRNQALSGLLARHVLTPDTTAYLVVWAAIVLVLGAAGVYAMVRFSRKGYPLFTLSTMALMMCTLQPYAVTHHWAIAVILVPLALVVWLRGYRLRWWLVALVAVQWWGPNKYVDPEQIYPAAWRAVGEIQGVTALVALIVFIVVAVRIDDHHPATRIR